MKNAILNQIEVEVGCRYTADITDFEIKHFSTMMNVVSDTTGENESVKKKAEACVSFVSKVMNKLDELHKRCHAQDALMEKMQQEYDVLKRERDTLKMMVELLPISRLESE